MKYLIDEDFKSFDTSEFPYDKFHTALGEYNHFEYGNCGDYYDPIPLHKWRSLDGSWIFTEEDGIKYLEQNRGDNCGDDAFINVYPTLVNKNTFYSPYSFSFDIRILEFNLWCGMAFYYKTSRDYYFVGLKPNSIALLRRLDEDIIVLKEEVIELDDLKTYSIKVELDYNKASLFLDSKKVFDLDINFNIGKIAFVSKSLARYSNFKVFMSDDNYLSHLNGIKLEEARLEEKRSKIPPLKLIHKIDLKNFGSGRQLRCIRDKGKTYFILMQNQKRYIRDSFQRLSSMTCFDVDGNILWQIGEPNNSYDNSYISCDLPCQVSDINGDSKLELIYSRDFYIYICDFYTLKVLHKFETPIIKDNPNFLNEPFRRLNVDMIRVADLEGLGYKGNLIIKDRYQNVIAYDKNFKELFRYHNKNTGHFPYVYDFNGDGIDELFIGYDLVSAKGEILVDLPYNTDHTDEIIYQSLKKNEPKRLILASGNEGFNMFNIDGSLYKHNEIGHAQRISVAPFRNKKDELEVCVTSFWGCNGIISLYDYKGDLICKREMEGNGSTITPINYDGIHNLILTYPDKSGGILDSNLDQVLLFPDDGHPTVCNEAYDIDGDGIDEILVWDNKKMYIYKTSMVLDNKRTYERYPDSGFSNYRGEYLIPNND